VQPHYQLGAAWCWFSPHCVKPDGPPYISVTAQGYRRCRTTHLLSRLEQFTVKTSPVGGDQATPSQPLDPSAFRQPAKRCNVREQINWRRTCFATRRERLKAHTARRKKKKKVADRVPNLVTRSNNLLLVAMLASLNFP